MGLLLLMRHAPARKASDWAPRKEELRPLTDRGFRRTRKVARRLAKRGFHPDLIVHSPLSRAAQTADLLAEVLKPPGGCVVCEALRPEISAGDMLKALATFFESGAMIVAVGHEPGLSHLASLLLVGNPQRIAIELNKGGWCLLRSDRWGPHARATLLALENPDLSSAVDDEANP